MEFRILGPLEILDDEGASVALRGSRERAVLALLLLSANRVVSTERLADDLWGDRPPEGAAHALQVHVSRLRKALRAAGGDEVLVTRPPGYLLRVDPAAVDAVRFDDLLAQGREEAARGDHHQAAVTLRDALGLWRGPALADVADAPAARAEAARLEEASLAALEDRVEADLACGRHGQLVAELDALTRAHPLRERLWAQRMVALYRTGRQAEALLAYQELRAVLGEGLGLEPSGALQRLETAILRQESDLDWPREDTGEPLRGREQRGVELPPAIPMPALLTEVGGVFNRTPFVGRESERATLSAALSRALQGSGSLILIGGEPGIGKTRLAEEAAAEAASRGMTVLAGHSYEMAGASPYVPFVEILEIALAGAESDEAFLADILGDAAPEVARLQPRLRRLFPTLPAPLDLPPEQERRYLFTCLSDVLARLAGARPTVVLLDDLHWADEPTLVFIEHLAPQLPQLALVVLATYRDDEVGRPLARTFEALHRRRLAQRLKLEGMAEAETAEVVRMLAGQDPPSVLVQGLHAETEGNPFFVEEVFRDLVEDDRLFGEDGRFRNDIDIAALKVPEGVRLVVGRRLERLSDDAQRLLVAAAVAGRVFSFRLLQALADLTADAVLEVVEEAEQAMLVREGAEEGEFLFAHELIRQTLVAGLSSPRRHRAHLRAAQAMIQVWAGSVEEHAAEIAHHLAEAGDEADPKQLLTYSLLAGQRALDTSAFEEALAQLERAAEFEAVAPPRQRAELFFALGSAHSRLGHWDAALAAWQRSLQEYEGLGDGDAVGRVSLEAGFNLAWANRFPEAVAMCQRGLAALGERVSADRARLLARLGSAANVGGDPVAGDAMFAEALRLADQLDNEALQGFTLGEMCCGLYISMRPSDAIASGLEGARIMRAIGDPWGAALALGFVEYALVHCGRFTDATKIGDELVPLAERVGNYPALYVHSRARASLEFWRDGNLDDMAAFGHRDVEFAEQHFPAFVGHCYSWLGLAAFLRGDWEEAGTWLERGSTNAPAIVPGFSWGSWFQYLAFSGRRDDALAFFEEKRTELPIPGQPNRWTAWTLLMAFTEGLFVLDERNEPADWYPLVLEARATGAIATDNFEGRLLERVAGIAATAAGNWDAAEAHFLLALRQADELPHQLERLETRRFYAQMLTERAGPGDRERAQLLLQEAIDGFSRLHMPRHADMARAAFDGLPS
jgi:DNA-binding SARP family transcriptional activator